MKNLLEPAGALWKTFGSDGIRRRARFELRKRFARFRKDAPAVPSRVLGYVPPERWPFHPNSRRLARATPHPVALTRANRVLGGEHHAFRAIWRRLPAVPEEWNTDLETGFRYGAVPWFRIPHSIVGSDIKDTWEPGRFTWAYDLARAWMLTRDDRYAQAFWASLESFRSGCPPYRGVQWACGQEAAIRAVSLMWAETALADAPSSTAARKASLRELLWWSGHRIADAIDYAISQRNNHGISETVGLIALGARFQDADAEADAWVRSGCALLERQVLDQFARDGWYAQHSFTYLRVALDQLVLAERVMKAMGRGLSTTVVERVRASIGLLRAVVDDETGALPNHGANDGAFVLPLTTGAFRDFRPSLTAAAATFRVALPQGVTPDAEVLAWLDVDPPPSTELVRPRVTIGESGWLDARVEDTRVFARAGVYRSRPSHIDALHLDVWVAGRPVAVDAGTYRYAGAWAGALAEERAHNTVAIEGQPMAVRGPRFLWLRWPRAVLSSVREDQASVTVDLLNESWRSRGIYHRRQCHITADSVTVLDEVTLPRDRAARVEVHWLLDGSCDDVVVIADVAAHAEISRGDEATPYGWIAESYAVKRPATSRRLITEGPVTRVRFASGFGTARSEEQLRFVLAHATAEPAPANLSAGGIG